MNIPYVISEANIQSAYTKAIIFLASSNWEYFNLVVQIADPLTNRTNEYEILTSFAKSIKIRTPKVVASTIFPQGMYTAANSREELYNKYNERLYPKAKFGRWGTYFNRMISYNVDGQEINQLENIISKIRQRKTHCKAAYTIYIQYPGNETTLKMGAPCLNYLALQFANDRIGLLATYRNHDFLERAYGNYVGLCNLIKFISLETGFQPGPLTCISSHAYILNHRQDLLNTCRNIENGMA